jgi:hypothetical protein
MNKMMNSAFKFGEQIDGFEVRVLNERAVRAAAGLVFLLAMIAFMNAWLLGNFQPTRVFVVAFLLDFTLRIFVNPRYAPSLIVGQWIVRKQQPEYVGAPQKRFAWAIGLVLALVMWYLVVLNNVIGPLNLIVCAACLTLLFFEAAFGICIGCRVYNFFHKEQAQQCPGGVCEVQPEQRPVVSLAQIAMVLLFAVGVGATAQWVYRTGPPTLSQAPQAGSATPAAAIDPAEAERCKVPDFAKAMGHEEKWKLHNHCR